MKLVQEKKAKRAKSAKEAKEVKEALEAKEVRISNVKFPPMDSTRLLPPLFHPTPRIPLFLCWLIGLLVAPSRFYPI